MKYFFLPGSIVADKEKVYYEYDILWILIICFTFLPSVISDYLLVNSFETQFGIWFR